MPQLESADGKLCSWEVAAGEVQVGMCSWEGAAGEAELRRCAWAGAAGEVHLRRCSLEGRCSWRDPDDRINCKTGIKPRIKPHHQSEGPPGKVQLGRCKWESAAGNAHLGRYSCEGPAWKMQLA